MSQIDRPPGAEHGGGRILLVNSASTLIARLLSLTAFLWVYQHLLHRIDPAEYQLLPIVTSIMVLVPLLTTVLTGALSRYSVVAYAQQNDRQVERIVSTTVPTLAVASVLFVALGGGVIWAAPRLLAIPVELIGHVRAMLALTFASIAIRLPLTPFTTGFQMTQRFVALSAIRVVTETVRVAALLFLILGIGPDVRSVVMATVLGELLESVLLTVYSRRLVPALRLRLAAFDRALAKEMLGFGGWNFLHLAGLAIRDSAPALILNRLALPIDVACYHIGTIATRHMQSLMIAGRTPFLPAMASLRAQDHHGRLASLYLRVGRYSLWLTLLVATPLFVFAPELIELYIGETYAAAATVMRLALVQIMLVAGTILVDDLARVRGDVRPWALRMFGVQMSIVAASIAFVALGAGAWGPAAAGLLATALLHTTLIWPLGARMAHTGLRRWLTGSFVRGLTPAVFAGVAAAAVPLEGAWQRVLIGGAVAAVVYVITLLTLASNADDRLELKRLLSKR